MNYWRQFRHQPFFRETRTTRGQAGRGAGPRPGDSDAGWTDRGCRPSAITRTPRRSWSPTASARSGVKGGAKPQREAERSGGSQRPLTRRRAAAPPARWQGSEESRSAWTSDMMSSASGPAALQPEVEAFVWVELASGRQVRPALIEEGEVLEVVVPADSSLERTGSPMPSRFEHEHIHVSERHLHDHIRAARPDG